jgi:hypothetical protein
MTFGSWGLGLGLVVPPSRADPRAVPEDYFTFMALSGPVTASRRSISCGGRCRNDSNAMARAIKRPCVGSGGRVSGPAPPGRHQLGNIAASLLGWGERDARLRTIVSSTKVMRFHAQKFHCLLGVVSKNSSRTRLPPARRTANPNGPAGSSSRLASIGLAVAFSLMHNTVCVAKRGLREATRALCSGARHRGRP